MDGSLGINEIEKFAAELAEKMDFQIRDYLEEENAFCKLYIGNNTFHQLSAYYRLGNGHKEHILGVIKEGKVDEFKRKAEAINSALKEYVEWLANNKDVVPPHEKRTFLYFRRVPSDFGIDYSLFERNKDFEEREEKEAAERHEIESGHRAFIEANGYDPCEDCMSNCHRCSFGFYDDGRYSVWDVYPMKQLV